MTTTTYLVCKDHVVSGEEFELRYDSELDMLITSPQPSQAELPKYYESEDYISHTDSKRNLFEKAYHFVRKISLKRKIKIINNSTRIKEKRLLDIGCGTGDFLKAAQDIGWQVLGIEPNQTARTIANKKTNNKVFDSKKINQFEKHSFDVITLWHVLEHLPNLKQQIQLLKALLKPNGTLIIAVPNYKSYDAKHYKQFWAAYDVPKHLWHFSKTSIQKLFLKEDMIVLKTLPLKFDAYYVSILSEKNKNGKNKFFSAFFIGWFSNLKAFFSKEYSSLIYVIKNQ